MSERGVFAVDRGIWDHPSFANEPLTEREAWAWLIGEASFKNRTKRIGSIVLQLVRGQVAASLRFMADKWQWSEPRVRRFLKRLKTDAMIDAATDAGITVITICNYNKYQRVSLPRDAATDADNDAAATQQRRKVEDTEDKELVLEGSAGARDLAVSDGWPSDYREQFWQRYPNKVGKPKALAKLDGIRRRGALVDFTDIMAGLDRYIRTKPPDRAWLNPETFLNQERWADQPAAVSAQGTNHGKRTVHDAARDLSASVAARIREFDEPAPELCDETGRNALRLLPSR